MRILIYHRRLDVLGGAEIATYDIASELSKRHKVELLTHNYDPNLFPFPEVHVVKIKNNVLSIIRCGLSFKKAFPMKDYDVLLIHSPVSGFFLPRIGISKIVWYMPEPPIRYFYSKQMGDPDELQSWPSKLRGWRTRQLDKILAKHVDSIVCYSRYMAGVVKKTFKRDPYVIPLGINIQRFPCLPLRETLDFAYLGRIALLKNVHSAVKALSLCVEYFPTATLTIRGSGISRKDEQLLKALVDSLGLNKNVVMEPSSKEVLSTYSNAQAVIYVTINEPFGLVPIEGMATCRPVIASNQGGMLDTVVDGETGFLVNPLDVNEIADRMMTLLRDFDLCRNMGLKGRRRVERHFTVQTTTAQLERILKS